MAAPTDSARQGTNITTAGTSHAINVGSPAAGTMLIVFVRFAAAPGTVTFTGYTLLATDTSDAADDTTNVYYRWADGSEGATDTLSTTNSVKLAAIAWEVTGAENEQPVISKAAIGTTAANSANPALSIPPPVFPTTSILDDFNRANEDPATGWTDIGTPGVEIISNTLGTDGAGGNAYFNTGVGGANPEVYATIASKPSTDNEIIMNSRRNPGGGGADEGYMVWFVTRSGTDEIQLRDPVDNILFTGNVELAVNDKFGMRNYSTTHQAWYKAGTGVWTPIGVGSDADNDGSGSKDKLSVYLGDDSTSKIDDFGGGVTTWAPADTLYLAMAGGDGEVGAYTAAPTNYGNLATANSGTGGTAATNVFIGGASRQLTASESEDPGAFTHGAHTTGWTAYTVALREPPAAAPASLLMPNLSDYRRRHYLHSR